MKKVIYKSGGRYESPSTNKGYGLLIPIDENGLDAIFIGPYDLSASMGLTADFKNIKFINALNKILDICTKKNIPYGIHVVKPDLNELNLRIKENYQFIAYSIDAFFLNSVCQNPIS